MCRGTVAPSCGRSPARNHTGSAPASRRLRHSRGYTRAFDARAGIGDRRAAAPRRRRGLRGRQPPPLPTPARPTPTPLGRRPRASPRGPGDSAIRARTVASSGTSAARYGSCRRSSSASTISSGRRCSMAATSSAARAPVYTASNNGTCGGITARACSVDSWYGGITATNSTGAGPNRRLCGPRAVFHESMIPPESAAATLSGCPSMLDGQRERVAAVAAPGLSGQHPGGDRGSARPEPAGERHRVGHVKLESPGIAARSRERPHEQVIGAALGYLGGSFPLGHDPHAVTTDDADFDPVAQLQRHSQAIEPRPQVGR